MRRFLVLFFLSFACAAYAAEETPPAQTQPQKPAKKKRKHRLKNPLKMPPGRTRPEDGPITPYDVKIPTVVPKGFAQPAEAQPWPVRLMVHPVKGGMFIGLPVVDTDPNRGVTMGVMPITVLQRAGNDRITSIWAPSVTYNKTFKANGTLRYYAYPTRESDLAVRGAWAEVNDRDATGDYRNRNFLGKGYDVGLRVQYNVDGSNRFFGIGPNTSIHSESNYSNSTFMTRAMVGAPLGKDSGWMAKLTPFIAGTKVNNGPIASIPSLSQAFPGFQTAGHHQNNNIKLSLDFDSRDQDITTTQGTYLGMSVDNSIPALGSEYAYQSYGVDWRGFHPWGGRLSRHVTAANVKFQQVQGNAPFWLMPQLGGKYIHRAYGEGRYIDKGLLTAQLEQRYVFYTARMSGVSTDFETAPFVGVGTVFEEPGAMSTRYFRPVVGGSVRAIARPQVVGSIDFGVGQEGLAAFMDINYSW